MLQFPFVSLRKNIYAVIVFFDIFDFPLTLEEIKKYVAGKRESAISVQELLEQEGSIRHAMINGATYYFLKGRSSIVHTSLQQKQISVKLWEKVHFFLPFIQTVPFIKMVAVCNTLGYDNAAKDSDIDLFIIAKRGRLFIVRFFTLLLFSLLGVRRHGKKVAGRFCLSFYIDEDFLNLEPLQLSRQDIYFPFWMITMQPIYGEGFYHHFMAKNLWLKKYFQHSMFDNGHFLRPTFLKIFGNFGEWLLKGKFGNWIENVFYHIQRKRHQKNVVNLSPNASVIVEKNILKFHNVDRRMEIQQKFEEKWGQIIVGLKNAQRKP